MNKNFSTDENIIIALERISEAFNVMMWEHNKQHGLSFVQLKILNFLMFNSNEENRNVSFISKEFNISKASVSDSIKNLEKKEIIFRIKINKSRKEILNLTEKGKNIASNIFGFTDNLKNIIAKINSEKKEIFLETLMYILHSLLTKNIISIQVMCSNCRFYIKDDNGNFKCLFSEDIEEYNRKFELLEENK